MSFGKDTRKTYGIGLLVTTTDANDLTKFTKIIDKINSFIKGNNPVSVDADSTPVWNDYVIKGINNPEIKIRTYIGFAPDVPDVIKDEFRLTDMDLLNHRDVWFNGDTFTYEFMSNYLKQMMKHNQVDKGWILNLNTATTGNILTKFEDI